MKKMRLFAKRLWNFLTKTKSRAVWLLSALIVELLLIANIMLTINTDSIGSVQTVFMAAILPVLVAVFLVLGAQQDRLKAFAKAHDLGFTSVVGDANMSGIIFNQGQRSGVIQDLFHTNEEFYIEFGNYEIQKPGVPLVTPDRTITYGFARIKLPRKVPNILLNATSNNKFLFGDNLPSVAQNYQKVELEGDFNKHFTVYKPKGYDADLYYLLPPDFMAYLVDHLSDYDLEFVDDELYLYRRPFNTDNLNDLENMLLFLKDIRPIIVDNQHRYVDERASAEREANVVAQEGRRLGRGFAWGTLILIVVLTTIFLLEFR